MINLSVDHEKLVFGLERGIGRVEDYVVHYWAIPKKYRLRTRTCGLASLAIQENLRQQEFSSAVKIRNLPVPIDGETQHVVSVLAEKDNDPTIIDATYSQLLGMVGLSWNYEVHTGKSAFPEEKIVVFNVSERDVVARSLAKLSAQFQAVNSHPIDHRGVDIGAGPLANATVSELEQAYATAWDPNKFRTWQPDEATVQAGRQISSYIPTGAIILC